MIEIIIWVIAIFIIGFIIAAVLTPFICLYESITGKKLIETEKEKQERERAEREKELNKKVAELTEKVEKLGGKK